MESGLSEYAGQSQNSVIQREASGTATGSRRELVEGIKAYWALILIDSAIMEWGRDRSCVRASLTCGFLMKKATRAKEMGYPYPTQHH